MLKTESGFTLIEVMVALAIFAVMAGAITLANSQNLAAAYQIEEQTEGRWVNENVLTKMRLSAAPDLGTKSESVEFNGREWKVEVEVAEYNFLADMGPAAQGMAQNSQLGQLAQLFAPHTRRVKLQAFPPNSDAPADILYAVLGDP